MVAISLIGLEEKIFCMSKGTQTQLLKLAIWANTSCIKMFYTTTTDKVHDLDQTAESNNPKQSDLRQIYQFNWVC